MLDLIYLGQVSWLDLISYYYKSSLDLNKPCTYVSYYMDII